MSSTRNPFRNVPPAAGAKPANAYTRFIPREELGEVASWRPGSFGAGLGMPEAPAAAAAAAPEPTAAEWHARVQAARQAGYQDGYRDGLVALENFKQQFAAQATAQVGTLLDAFDRQLAAMDERLAETLARTAVQLAREVVRNELVTHPSLVARVAADALGAVMLSAKHITVLAHPQDLPLIAAGAEETLAARGARLVADAAVERGGVRIESDVGRVDAGIARRWQQASEVLAAEVNWAPPAAAANAGPSVATSAATSVGTIKASGPSEPTDTPATKPESAP
ncbi:MAG: flagellar assembly protein FliH [Burkholderiales bacterium]|nr:flagellar assembly protein FliH [Burkholderiales bacterium]